MSVAKGLMAKASNVGFATLAMLSASTAHGQNLTAFKSGEVQTGMTKQCFYDALGSQHTLTVSSVELCPLTIQVQTGPSYSTPAPSVGNRGVAFKSGEQVTGMTKQCFYNYLGSTVSRTISAVSLCPLSIPIG